MGKKSKRNRGASTKLQSARRGLQEQSGVTNTTSATSDVAVVVGREMIEPSTTSASIRSDPIDSLLAEVTMKGDHEGILKLESDAILRATVLEGTEPEIASSIYIVIARSLVVEIGLSSTIAQEKAIHYLERAFALSEKDIKLQHDCVNLLVSIYLHKGRHDDAFATVKRLASRIPQHELIDPDLVLNFVHKFSAATQFERVIDVLTIFLGTINRSWDKEKRAAAYVAFGKGYTSLTEYEKAASFLHKALAITDDTERKVAVLRQMGSISEFSCNYDDALAALNQALEIISAESGERREKFKRWSKHTALVHAQIGDVLSERGGA